MPTELNRRLVAGELDVAPISSIEYARHADTLRLMPRLCVSSEGAVESIQLDLEDTARQDPFGRGDARVGDVGRSDEGVVPGRGAGSARRGGRGEAADRRRCAQVGVRGSDTAPRSRSPVARAHRSADGVRGLGGAEPSRPVSPSSRRRSSSRSGRPGRAGAARVRVGGALRLSARFLARYFEKLRYRFGPRERAGLYTFLELAREVGELPEVPELRFISATAPV